MTPGPVLASDSSLADFRACLAALLPPGAAVALRRAPFSEPVLFEDEEAAARRMAPHRRREFGAGRDAAREALARLGAAPASLPRTVGRGPRWPEGFLGSITHTNELAMAAVIRCEPGLVGLGIDIERIDRVDERLVARIAVPEEIAALGRFGDAGAERALLFAARECVHKCWAPATEEMLVFGDVGIEVDDGRFAVRARGDVPDRFAGLRWEGRWRRAAGMCIATLVLREYPA